MTSQKNCDGCTMCCKLMEVGDKPPMQWCTKCNVGVGCTIYEARPEECRTFHCGYLRMAQLDEAWRPSRSKMVVAIGPGENRIIVFVDRTRIGQWRKEPYYSTIKGWARALCPQAGQVLVHDGPEIIAILPDREKSFGPQRPGLKLTSSAKPGPDGLICDVIAVETDSAAA